MDHTFWHAAGAAGAGDAKQAAAKKAAKKKRGSNRARTFQNGLNQLIPDDPPGASFPGQLDSTIDVGKKLKGKAVADVNVSVRITHPDTDDLDLFLISPQGATVLLASNNPGQAGNTGYGSGDPNCNGAFTTFDDANWLPLTWFAHMHEAELFGLLSDGNSRDLFRNHVLA